MLTLALLPFAAIGLLLVGGELWARLEWHFERRIHGALVARHAARPAAHHETCWPFDCAAMAE